MENLGGKTTEKQEGPRLEEPKLTRLTHASAQRLRMRRKRDPVKRGISAMQRGRKLTRTIYQRLRLRSRPAGGLGVRKPQAFSISASDRFPTNVGNFAVPTHVPRSSETEPNLADGDKFDRWKSTASSTAKLLLRGVRESADAFPLLKSVAGGLCYILENCEVRPSSRIFHA